MTNYGDAGIELTLIDGRKIDFYPSGLITGEDDTYLPQLPQTNKDEIQRELKNYTRSLFKDNLLNSISIYCGNYSVCIKTSSPELHIPFFSKLPETKFEHTVDTSDLVIPVTRMSKPSSNGEIYASRTSLSGKIETDSFLVREQRIAIREARRQSVGKVDNCEETFKEGMDKYNNRLPRIAAELIDAGKAHLNLLSDFHKASIKRPFLKQVLETPSRKKIRWNQFNHT